MKEEISLVHVRGPQGAETVELRFPTTRPYWLRLTFADGRVLEVKNNAPTLSGCLTRLRKRLEREGMLICCQGARRDVWGPGLPSDPGHRTAYQHTRDRATTDEDLVDIFAPAHCDDVTTLSEQLAELTKWDEQLRIEGEAKQVQVCCPRGMETADLRIAVAPPYWLRLTWSDGRVLKVEEEGLDLLACLTRLRESLEAQGRLICCQGARRNVWPSGLIRQMSGGRTAHEMVGDGYMTLGEPVDIFAPADCNDVVTLAEQEDEWAKWFEKDTGRVFPRIYHHKVNEEQD